MAFSLRKIIRAIFYSIRFRVFIIMAVVAVAISSVFLFISHLETKTTRAISQLAYIDELKLLISDYYWYSVKGSTEEDTKKLHIKSQLLLDKEGSVYKFATQSSEEPYLSGVSDINELFLMVQQAGRINDSYQLERLVIQSQQYPKISTYNALTSLTGAGIQSMVVNRSLLITILVGTLILAFIFLQIIAARIGMISNTTHMLIGQEDQLDVSIRPRFYANDETRIIIDNLNLFLSRIENSISLTYMSLRKMLYQTNKMNDESEGGQLEIQVIQDSTERIFRQIHHQIGSISEAAAALEEMERTLDMIFINISRQSAAMTQSAATLEEMGRQVEGIAGIATDTSNLAVKLTEAANKGNEAVEASVVSIRDVAEYSTQIIKLLKLITDIAKQTNLLAMNASIEAAHAGEAGRGFAIVAEEIRRLSETTNKNAKEIRTVVDTMVEKIENSVSQAHTAGEDLLQINEYANNVEDRISQLNNMMQEQNTATHEMIGTIEGLVTLAQEIKLSMEEQKHGLHEYSTTISMLRENFTDTKSSLDSHKSSIDNLLRIMEDVNIRIELNKKQMETIVTFIRYFKINPEYIVSENAIEQEQEQEFINIKTSEIVR
ncbi:Methyl-accepting chemotaxis protein [Brevinema andersonii]|uniref:Methyl-accepting chemotaxis protein n=1 Tax=Brevinema andersonii TaxID=34097 RepID=A0A1I1EF75_BREAD|nr:methyl-accepting chemotaxis protein [Brevinema andersonii]SFB83583.1 Methyl-accepting chemotaxis protein [Brevinema andersonii]